MSDLNRGPDADQDSPLDSQSSPDERAPRYLQLLALPIIIIFLLALAGLIFYWVYSARPQPVGPEQISGSPALSTADPQPPHGRRVPTFEARAVSGQRLSFPGDYKHKLVMLDFWATWCGPCVGEIPNTVEAYENFHSKGFEILGISLDGLTRGRASPEAVLNFAKARKALWPQVYDNAMAIAEQFQVATIPAAFLVDGDTGRLLASGEDLRGARLADTIRKSLEQKKGSRP